MLSSIIFENEKNVSKIHSGGSLSEKLTSSLRFFGSLSSHKIFFFCLCWFLTKNLASFGNLTIQIYKMWRFRRPKSEKMEILTTQIQFLDLVYGDKFLKSLNILMLVSKTENSRLKQQSEKFVKKLFKKFNYFPKVRLLP